MSYNVNKHCHYDRNTVNTVSTVNAVNTVKSVNTANTVNNVDLASGSMSQILLGAFSKLRKAAISFVMSVRPSARMEQLGSHWTDFHKIRYLGILQKSVEKIKVSLKSDKNKRYFT
jgi:hypothetical protein